LAERWPALLVEAPAVDDSADVLAVLLDDLSPSAIEDLAEIPIPPGGLWDATFGPVPDPSPAPLRWRIHFATGTDRDRAAEAIHRACPHLALRSIAVDDEDWAARSQASLKAVHAGRFIVAPPWDLPRSVPPDTHLIVIEPSMGFGTGHHATTRLCLRLLSTIDVTARRVLDIGTGSGVLAMGAALCGAAEVDGLDVDQDAIRSAEASAALNTLPPVIRFSVGDFRTAPPAPGDVVFANLTGGMLRSAAAPLAALVSPGGRLVVSGFDHSEADAVREAFTGLSEVRRLDEEEWVALELR